MEFRRFLGTREAFPPQTPRQIDRPVPGPVAVLPSLLSTLTLLLIKERVEMDINGCSLARLQESGENG
jgi:hypothetical protein